MKYPIKNLLKCLITNFIFKRPLPLILSLDVTQRCNAKCPFCGYWRLTNPAEPSLNEIKKIFDDAYDLGCAISVITGGEPLLRKDISSIIEYAKKKGFLTFLLTNGYLLPERLSEFHKHPDVISVSIDFPDSRHDETRCLPGLLERALTGLSLANDYGIATNINSILTGTHSLEDVKKLIYLSKKVNSGISFSPIFVTANKNLPGSILGRWSSNEDYSLMRINDWEHIKSIADMLIFYKKHGFNIQNSGTYLKLIRDKAGFTCYPFSLQIGVSSTGIVGAMCPMGINGSNRLGSALKNSLRDIWYSNKAEMLRDNFKKCKLTNSLGCYLLCVAEPSLSFCKPETLLDYIKRFWDTYISK